MASPDDSGSTPELVEALRNPDAYPHRPESVEEIHTHISWLFLAGDRVYKVKKPVDLGFLDYRDRERRRHFCEEEVRLNKRLAEGMYRGVVPITRSANGSIKVGGEGEVIDHAVEMVRLPEQRLLDHMLDRGAVDNALIRRLAGRLASFHEKARTGPEVAAFGSPERLRARFAEHLGRLEDLARPDRSGDDASRRSLTPAALLRLCRAYDRFFEGHDELLRRRVREDRIREGHGDLHAGNICVRDDELWIYDCIEFNEEFRCLDVAQDLAFLLMDLDRRGYPAFGQYLALDYARLSGDGELAQLLPLYKSYLATVRGLVASLRAEQEEGAADQQRSRASLAESRRYFRLAVTYTLPPVVVLTCGLPASGKSHVARALGREIRASVLRSDVTRKELAGVSPYSHDAGDPLYSRPATEQTYRQLLQKVGECISRSQPAIVDATFARREHREWFRDWCEQHAVPVLLVHCRAQPAVIEARLAERKTDPLEPSDADLAVYRRAREVFEEPAEWPEQELVRCESPEPDDVTAEKAFAALLFLDPPLAL